MIDFIKPKVIEKTGDDRPVTTLRAFVWRMSGGHQIALALIAITVAALNIAPLELQRRIVDGAIADFDLNSLFQLGAIYLGVVITMQITKFAMRMYQTWLAESIIHYIRRHILGLAQDTADSDEDDDPRGERVAIVTTEVEKLGGFVGTQVSDAVGNVAVLIVGIGYMMVVAPGVGLVGLAFLVPQVVLTPLVQKTINRLIEERVDMVRGLSSATGEGALREAREQLTPKLFRNRIHIGLVKFALKAALNLLNALAPISVLVFGGYLVVQGELAVGTIVAFLSGFERMAGPARELIVAYRNIAQAQVQHDLVADWIRLQLKRS